MDSVFQELVKLIRIRNTELFKAEFFQLKDPHMTDSRGNNLIFYAQKYKAESIYRFLKGTGMPIRSGGLNRFLKTSVLDFIYSIREWLARRKQNKKPVSLISLAVSIIFAFTSANALAGSFISNPPLETGLTPVSLVYQSLEQIQNPKKRIHLIQTSSHKDVFLIPETEFLQMMKNGFIEETPPGTLLTAEIKSEYKSWLGDTNISYIPVVTLKSAGKEWIKQNLFSSHNVIRFAVFIPLVALSIFIAVSRYRRFLNQE